MNEKMKDILANLDIDSMVKEFNTKKEKEDQLKLSFWNDPLCEKMIGDMIQANKGFDEEEFAYFPEQVKSKFGWENLTNEQIHLFIDVMYDCQLGLPDNFEPTVDEQCPFENYSFVKKGIHVFVMYGQGVAIILKPEALHAELSKQI